MDRGLYMFQARSGHDCAVLTMLAMSRDVEHVELSGVERVLSVLSAVERVLSVLRAVERC